MMNRRDLLKAGVGAMPMLAGASALAESAHVHGAATGATAADPRLPPRCPGNARSAASASRT